MDIGPFWGSVLRVRPVVAWPSPRVTPVWAARVPSASQQLLCAIQMLPLAQCLNSPKEVLVSDLEVLGCQPDTQCSPCLPSSMRTLPQIGGAGDALQRGRENKDNMHSSQHTKAKENNDSPSRRGILGN